MNVVSSIKCFSVIVCVCCIFNTLNAQDLSALSSQGKRTDDAAGLTRIAVMSLRILHHKNALEASLAGWTIATTAKQILSSAPGEWNENDVVCFILDEHETILDTLILRHPLRVRYEYPTDDQFIGSITVDETETEVLLRFPYDEEMKFMRVTKVNHNRQLDVLSLFPLPEVKK